MKILMLLVLLITVPCALAGYLFVIAGAGTISFLQAFSAAMGLFVLMNCAVSLSGKTATNTFIIQGEDDDEQS